MFRRFLIVLISVIASIPFLTSSYSVGTITLEEFQDARNGFLFYPKLLAELCTFALQLYVRLSCHKHEGQYTWEEAHKISQIVESYLFRRQITDKKTNVLNKLFASLAREIAPVGESGRLIKELVSKGGTQVFPRDSEFVNSFKTIDMYNRRNNVAKLALMMLESNRSKETIDFNSIQVEHIMPQTLTNEWKISVNNAVDVQAKYGDTIGNLTLTGYNSELSNKLFIEKTNLYKNSNISITRELSEKYSEWNATTIEFRANKLSQEALSIWKFPVQNTDEELQSVSGEHFLDEDISVKGSKPKTITMDGRDYKTESWKKLLLVFLDFVWDIDSQTFSKLKKKEALKRLFVTDESRKNPGKLANGEIVETNYSADSIISIIKIISLEYNIFDDVSFTLL